MLYRSEQPEKIQWGVQTADVSILFMIFDGKSRKAEVKYQYLNEGLYGWQGSWIAQWMLLHCTLRFKTACSATCYASYKKGSVMLIVHTWPMLCIVQCIVQEEIRLDVVFNIICECCGILHQTDNTMSKKMRFSRTFSVSFRRQDLRYAGPAKYLHLSLSQKATDMKGLCSSS